METHRAVLTWILQVLATADLIRGKTIGIDATTLEANAALRSIVRRDSGEIYQEFLTQLAHASGMATPTRADLARLDRTRPQKGRNTDWQHPHDPDARITKMKDGRTHLAHTAEHAVDLETGAIVGVTVQGADRQLLFAQAPQLGRDPQMFIEHRLEIPLDNRSADHIRVRLRLAAQCRKEPPLIQVVPQPAPRGFQCVGIAVFTNRSIPMAVERTPDDDARS